MNLGKYQLVISVSVILASAVVALLVDYLKRNNEKLREANVDLKAKRAEELKRIRRAAARTAEAKAEADKLPQAEPATPELSATAPLAVTATAPLSKHIELDPKPVATQARASASPTIPDPATAKLAATLAQIMNQPRAAANLTPVSTIHNPTTQPPTTQTPWLKASARKEQSSMPAPPPVTESGSRRNWGALLKSARPSASAVIEQTEQLVAPVATASVMPIQPVIAPFLPAGFHSDAILQASIEANRHVNGVAVSISASVTDGSSLDDVDTLVKSLLEEKDFAASSAQGEYVLILRNESGARAQRRLNLIAQELWNFQIESLRDHPVVFCWGGVEVHNQLLDEAIAGAQERMLETKRNRKVLPMASREQGTRLRRRAI